MTELPPPDLKDQAGRLRRLVLALIVGSAVATATYLVCDGMAKPETQATTGGFKFVFYMTGFFGAGAFIATLAITNAIAKKKWRESLVARAEVVREPLA